MLKFNTNKTSCHPEVKAEGSFRRFFTCVQNDRAEESGRSMVEMLGVLAIVGVLSVMGIAGYTVAMNSHRTNEVLNQASRLAMIVAAQKLAGSTNPLLSDSDKNASGQYQFELANGTGSFTLTAKNVPEAVRTKLSGMNMAGVTIDASTANVTFTFNDDLGEGSGESGNIDTGSCDTGYVYLSYETNPCATTTPKKGDTGMECVKNSDCDPGEYCKITASSCSVITGGTCETLDAGTPSAIGRAGGSTDTNANVAFTAGRFLMGPDLTWWAAENWCKAHGKSLVSLSDLGITGGYSEGYCGGSDCLGTDWLALRQAIGHDYNWTANSYNSCYAFYVYIPSQEASGDDRGRHRNMNALCE